MKRNKLNFFCDETLKKYISKKDFKRYQILKQNHEKLDNDLIDKVAKALKKWAIENGATHYSHWFFPLTCKTAGKQTAFFEYEKEKEIDKFEAKNLILGETDASSFPNGGERMTFEARGYTVWDYTSYAILQEYKDAKVLLIPTAFCSYHGTALDEKTPLLRAYQNFKIKALKLLKKLGFEKIKDVFFNVGSEQEYFLIDKNEYEKRPDLVLTNRTLFGGESIKTQEGTHHYFQAISSKIHAYMHEVNTILKSYGISVSLQHNEVAPKQHEIVPKYTEVNKACDQNQLIMETLIAVAEKHDFVAILKEKPFKNINGSGKHMNWSISTDTGINLFDLTTQDKTLPLIFITLVISAIDEYSPLVKLACSHYGNDLRLGGDEAPPQIISIYLGDALCDLLFNFGVENKNKNQLDLKLKTQPNISVDSCDRNRTSPFAFTGNKFEYRMIGSSQSLSFANTVLLTILAQKCDEFAEKIDDKSVVSKVINNEIQKHKKIIFNGNGYSKEWKEEAEKRKLKIFNDCIGCMETFDEKKNVELFEKQNVLTKKEILLRKEIFYKNFNEEIKTEANCMYQMLEKQVLPSFVKSQQNTQKINEKTTFSQEKNDKIIKVINKLSTNSNQLLALLKAHSEKENELEKAKFANQEIIQKMKEIREIYDENEILIESEYMPFPTYNEILFNAPI